MRHRYQMTFRKLHTSTDNIRKNSTENCLHTPLYHYKINSNRKSKIVIMEVPVYCQIYLDLTKIIQPMIKNWFHLDFVSYSHNIFNNHFSQGRNNNSLYCFSFPTSILYLNKTCYEWKGFVIERKNGSGDDEIEVDKVVK